MSATTRALDPGRSVLVEGGRDVGVLVLSADGTRLDADRCQVLAERGATALSVAWRGPLGQVALESLDEPLARLHERCERVAVVGTSRGAELALLLGTIHRDLAAVAAFSPTDVVWAALASARPQRSSWTRAGESLAFVPYDDDWETLSDPVELVGLHEQSLATFADRLPAARIPVDKIAGEVLLTAGGDDRRWPALDSADEIVVQRARAGLATSLVDHPGAGHRVVLPGEPSPRARPGFAQGGIADSDRELGRLAWRPLLAVLGLD